MTIWTEPTNLVLGVESDAAQVNDEVIANIRNLYERNHLRGIVASATATSNTGAFSVSGNISDMEVVANVRPDRAYRIHFDSAWSAGGAGSWTVDMRVNGGVYIGRVGWAAAVAAGVGYMSGACLWLPDIEGAVGIMPVLNERAGATTITFAANASTPRKCYVEDIGARPT